MKLYPISVQLVSFTNIKGLILGKCNSGHQKCHYEFTNVTLIGLSKKSMTSLWVNFGRREKWIPKRGILLIVTSFYARV